MVRTAIVTGGSRGIGLEAARDLLARGWQVAITARSAAPLERARDDLGGERILAVCCDVGDSASVSSMVEHVRNEFGPIHALVNNAGVIDPVGSITTVDPEAWNALLRVNIGGLLHTTQAILPDMTARGEGVIVNLSSGAARNAVAGWSAYCASKAAAAMFTSCVHAEYAALGLKIYGFVPGAVQTDLLAGARRSYDNQIARMDEDDLLPPDLPGRCIGWIVDSAPADWSGRELSIRDPELRARVGLKEGWKW